MIKNKLALFIFLVFCLSSLSYGQIGYRVVAACPTTTIYTVGQYQAPTIDVTGTVCTSSSGGGGGGGGLSVTDEAPYVPGTSLFTPSGGFFQTTPTNNQLINQQQGMYQMTATREIFVNLRNASAVEIGTASTPIQVSLANTGSNATSVLISAASLPLPTGAATSANQTSGGQKTQIVDGTGNVIASTSNNLNVQCANCSGTGASAVDAATFTASSSVMAPAGVFYQTTATANALTTGHQGMIQGTANRAIFVNLRDSSANEEGITTNPLFIQVGDGKNVALGATTDAACTSSGSTCTLESRIAKIENLAEQVGPLASSASVSVVQCSTSPTCNFQVVLNDVSNNGLTSNSSTFSSKHALDTNMLGTLGTAFSTAGYVDVLQKGCSNKVIEPGASDNHQVVQNGASVLCDIIVFNNSATVNYGRVYNAGTGFNGCNSATNLAFEFQIPASTSVGGFVIPLPQGGLPLATGLSVCITGAYGQTDTTAATASAISANFGYR